MLNIMPMTAAIMPQFVYDFIIFNDWISKFRLQINFYLLFQDSLLLFLIYYRNNYNSLTSAKLPPKNGGGQLKCIFMDKNADKITCKLKRYTRH